MPLIERIILIDDNDLDNTYHSIVLRKAGFSGELLVLESGVQLIDFLRKHPRSTPTLLFIDINMPLLNGFETVTKLVELSLLNADLQVHILSSSDAAEDLQMARSLPPVRSYLVKPLNVADAKRLLAASG
jgi:CheY-like chemotaxis protein